MKKANLDKIKRYSVKDRPTKSSVKSFARIPGPNKSFFDSLPDYLKAADLKNLAQDIVNARKRGKMIIWMMGAHPIKVGLSPVIIDLMKLGYINHLALNGAGIIHDLEVAMWGRTSEEVADTLADGSFGMVEETPKYLADAISVAAANLGLGNSMAEYISNKKCKYNKFSIFAGAYRYKVPISVHIAIGTDTICQHPEFDAALWGEKSHQDFLLLAENIKKINNGGVVINFGSAVVLPEVFLKALTVARNLNANVRNFTAANFDMIQHYRANENVVRRPTLPGGHKYSITGHHEIMMPLLAAAIKSVKK